MILYLGLGKTLFYVFSVQAVLYIFFMLRPVRQFFLILRQVEVRYENRVIMTFDVKTTTGHELIE
jgi:hypothetical protein